jgi:hypothetical protein
VETADRIASLSHEAITGHSAALNEVAWPLLRLSQQNSELIQARPNPRRTDGMRKREQSASIACVMISIVSGGKVAYAKSFTDPAQGFDRARRAIDSSASSSVAAFQ